MATLRVTSLMGHTRSGKTGDKYMSSVLKELKLNTGSSLSLQTSRMTYVSAPGKIQGMKPKKAAIFGFFLMSWIISYFLFL